MGATVQTGETSPGTAAFAGPRETAQATRSASASKHSASVAVEELPEERQDHESRDFDSLLGMVIGVRDANHQTAEFVRKVALANRRAIANQRLTEDDLRVMDDAAQKNSTDPQRGPGHSRLSAVAVQRGQRGQGSLSYLYRPAEAESGGPARSVLDLELHGGRKRAGSDARPDGSDGRHSPMTTRSHPPPGGAVRAGMEQVDDQHHRWPAGREGGAPATTVKRAVESAGPSSAALRPSRAATSPNRPNEAPIVPARTVAPSTQGASPQGSGL